MCDSCADVEGVKRGRKKKLKTLEDIAPKATFVQAHNNVPNNLRQASRGRGADENKGKK